MMMMSYNKGHHKETFSNKPHRSMTLAESSGMARMKQRGIEDGKNEKE